MAEVLLQHALETLLVAMNNLISRHGDGPLPAGLDPYHLQNSEGTILELHSNQAGHQHLTYNQILLTAQGLMDVLLDGHRYHEARFGIYESSSDRLTRVGNGRIAHPNH